MSEHTWGWGWGGCDDDWRGRWHGHWRRHRGDDCDRYEWRDRW